MDTCHPVRGQEPRAGLLAAQPLAPPRAPISEISHRGWKCTTLRQNSLTAVLSLHWTVGRFIENTKLPIKILPESCLAPLSRSISFQLPSNHFLTSSGKPDKDKISFPVSSQKVSSNFFWQIYLLLNFCQSISQRWLLWMVWMFWRKIYFFWNFCQTLLCQVFEPNAYAWS